MNSCEDLIARLEDMREDLLIMKIKIENLRKEIKKSLDETGSKVEAQGILENKQKMKP